MRAVVARAAVLAGAFTAGVVTARLAGTPRTLRVTGELRRSRARILATREEERRRLRHDLHDDLGPSLASLALTVDAARLTLSSEPEQVGPVLTELRDRLAGAVGEIRDLARGLRPPALDDLGLVTAIETLADGCGDRVDVRFDGSPADLPAAVEVAAYRIVAEAVANIRAHARAPSALILLSRADDLHILVADSGVGLPPPGRTRGRGLDAMREWAAEVGGNCAIGSRPGGGTVVAARLPLAVAG
ncbi:Sensor histidine kinase LiaS [Actinomadura rubteroloni]|uniref:Oxygen sensor histidine kinase NreB n=1 Tax=Actinomadura rubteroloni TaxID=1926885 RepID=A0A2P4URZ4_9ACTN|nr:histidine kinase [Actinomadura rubteroloni]POM27823.1 Sensor histidine kinase LiaS [Actinomadura rubteroloni]